ncbi:MAG: DUF2269 family protein [Gammaproteobacteria bacterium]|nr:DUF2269 family protein [Gammaproteobacteria bacterium]
MLLYQLAKFAHLVGTLMLGGGIIGLFVTDMRARQLGDLKTYAEMVRTSSVYQWGWVTPGVFFLFTSGALLTAYFYNGWNFIEIPWLAGMVILFAYEFIEGNVFMRMHKKKVGHCIQESVAKGYVTRHLKRKRDDGLYTFLHFLDLPNFMLIVSLGALRPTKWTHILVGLGLSLLVATILNYMVPRLYPWQVDQEGKSDIKASTILSN